MHEGVASVSKPGPVVLWLRHVVAVAKPLAALRYPRVASLREHDVLIDPGRYVDCGFRWYFSTLWQLDAVEGGWLIGRPC